MLQFYAWEVVVVGKPAAQSGLSGPSSCPERGWLTTAGGVVRIEKAPASEGYWLRTL